MKIPNTDRYVRNRASLLVLSTMIYLASISFADAQTPAPPVDSSMPSHFAGVNERGDTGMGFSHAKTTHHFRLYKDGGAIGVDTNDPKDEESKGQVRQHLQMIARKFKAGDFSLPMFIHATTPPGMKTMQRLKARIEYRYEETPGGAQVRLSTKDQAARDAIHSFLRFQIKDHHTGDPTTIR